MMQGCTDHGKQVDASEHKSVWQWGRKLQEARGYKEDKMEVVQIIQAWDT